MHAGYAVTPDDLLSMEEMGLNMQDFIVNHVKRAKEIDGALAKLNHYSALWANEWSKHKEGKPHVDAFIRRINEDLAGKEEAKDEPMSSDDWFEAQKKARNALRGS